MEGEERESKWEWEQNTEGERKKREEGKVVT